MSICNFGNLRSQPESSVIYVSCVTKSKLCCPYKEEVTGFYHQKRLKQLISKFVVETRKGTKNSNVNWVKSTQLITF